MHTDELTPGRGLLPLRSRWDAVTLEDVAHGLIAQRVAQMVECPHHAIVTPRTILSSHAYHQRFYYRVNTRTSNRFARRSAIICLGNACTMPGKDGLRLRNRGDLCQSLLAELLPHLRQGLALCVCELHPSCDVVTQEAVFHRQIRIAQAEFLIHRACGRRQ